MGQAGLGDVSTVKVVKRLGLRCRRLERIVRDVGRGCRARSNGWHGKLIAWPREWRVVRMNMGVSWRGGIIEDGGNKPRRICRMWHTVRMGQSMDHSAFFGEGG
jgi:hypothetical protein